MLNIHTVIPPPDVEVMMKLDPGQLGGWGGACCLRRWLHMDCLPLSLSSYPCPVLILGAVFWTQFAGPVYAVVASFSLKSHSPQRVSLHVCIVQQRSKVFQPFSLHGPCCSILTVIQIIYGL